MLHTSWGVTRKKNDTPLTAKLNKLRRHSSAPPRTLHTTGTGQIRLFTALKPNRDLADKVVA